MPVYHRYSEDPTGVSPDNLVQGETITLNDRPIRFAIPKYAPFFTEGFVLYDNTTQRLLIKGVDYRFPIISREATLRYGKEVADAIIIENKDVSPQLRVTYQCVGGSEQNNIDNIVKIYESFLKDGRSVDWVSGILGKPSEFPPGPHPHYLSEVFGFEPLTFELERLAQAIQLGNAPAFDAILQAIQDLGVTNEEIDIGKANKKFITLEALLYSLDKFNFNTIVMTPNLADIFNGGNKWFNIQATNVAERVVYYWTIKHDTTVIDDFQTTSGVINLNGGKGMFMIQAKLNSEREDDEVFRIEIRRGGIEGPVLYTTDALTLLAHDSYTEDRILEGVRIEDINSPRLQVTAKTYAAHQGAWDATFN